MTLLGKEHPDMIIDSNIITLQELNLFEVKYSKDGKFYIARSYFTSAWISKEPCGPEFIKSNKLSKFSDIARIEEYKCSSMSEFKKLKFTSVIDLASYYEKARLSLESWVINSYKELGKYEIQITLKHTPLIHADCLIGTKSSNGTVKLLGCITFYKNMEPVITSILDNEIRVVFEKINPKYERIGCGNG